MGTSIVWLIMVIVVAVILLQQRPVSNCQGCAWRTPGQCRHPTASQVPELPDIQVGRYRCPWKEVMRRG